MRGSDELASALEDLIEKEGLKKEVEIVGSFCMGECSTGVSVKVDDSPFREIRCEEVEAFFNREILPRTRKKDEAPCQTTG